MVLPRCIHPLTAFALAAVVCACGPDGRLPMHGGSESLPPPPSFGPRIRVAPSSTLTFGQVPHFPGAPAVAERVVTVFNAGVEGPSSATLHLRAVRIQPLTQNALAEELGVEFPPGSDATSALTARAGSNALELRVTLAPGSEGLKRWALVIASNDPERPELRVEVTADVRAPGPCKVAVTPSRIDLPHVGVPEVRDVVVDLRNEGQAPTEACLLSHLQLGIGTHPAIRLRDGRIAQRVLQPGEALPIHLQIEPHPSAGGKSIEGELSFAVSSPARPRISVPIHARVGAESCIATSPSELDFGTVREGCTSAPRTVTLYNLCTTDLFVTHPAIIGPASAFRLVQTPASGPEGIRVRPQSPVTIALRYEPDAVATDVATVRFSAANNPDAYSWAVPLTGKAAPFGPFTDVFVQDPLPKVDLLLVIDTAPSMANEQPSVASNLAAMLQYVKGLGVDFQLGVITADPAQGASLRSGPTHPETVLTRTTANLDAKFADKVNVGTSGSGASRCLAQGLDALSAPLVGTDNAGFLRPDAALSIICITDGLETSPLAVIDYLNGYWGIVGPNRKSMFTFSAIAGLSPSCPGDQGRLAAAVSQTNGIKDDICTPDWHKALEPFGRAGFTFRTNFFLTSVPDLSRGPIEVRIDGQLIPPTLTGNDVVWTYDPVGNSINFEPLYVPEPGQTIEVRYSPTCRP